MAWLTAATWAGIATAATGAYVALNQPKAPQLQPQVNTREDTAQVGVNRASDRRRSLMGGGIASTILSQTGEPGVTGKQLLGS